MELKTLIKNTYHLASARMVKFILGLFRAKLNALFLGTIGMGITSQILYTTTMFSNFTLLGMNDGIVKQIASCKEDKSLRDQILNTLKSYFVIVFVTSAIVVALSLIFSERLTIYFFGESKYFIYYLVCVASFPILIFNSISFALLKSFKSIQKIAKAELLATVLSFFLFVPMVYFLHLTGAVSVLVLTLVIKFIFNHLYSKKDVLDKFSISYSDVFRSGKIVRADINELIMFAGYGLSIGVYQMITEVVSRAYVIKILGIDKLGLYAPNLSWGGLFSGMMLPTIFTYLYPRFSEAKKDIEINGVLNDVFRLVTFAMTPFLFGGIAFRKIVIPLFYSNEFIEAANYLPGHFLGILFTMWMYSFTQVFTPTGRIRIYVFFLFIMYTINVAIIYFLVPQIGLYGWMLRFIVTPVIFFAVFYLYLHKAISFQFDVDNRKIMLYVVSTGLLLYWLTEQNAIGGYVLGIILIVIVWFFLRESEKRQIVSKMASFIKLKK
jgi:O-antigen/teichoic acid export membrane protein